MTRRYSAFVRSTGCMTTAARVLALRWRGLYLRRNSYTSCLLLQRRKDSWGYIANSHGACFGRSCRTALGDGWGNRSSNFPLVPWDLPLLPKLFCFPRSEKKPRLHLLRKQYVHGLSGGRLQHEYRPQYHGRTSDSLTANTRTIIRIATYYPHQLNANART